MPAHIRNQSALALIYGTRDNYVGEFQPPVAEIRQPAKLIHMRRSGNTVLLAITDGADVTYLRVTSPDDPRLQVLGADDRNQVQALAIAIKRTAQENGNAA